MKGRILILMSTYNGELYLSEQLASIVGQQDIDWHLLVRDDNSSDKTVAILHEWERRYSGRITVYEGENLGYALSFTKLIGIALTEFGEYDWMAFADQDDVWDERKLASGWDFICEAGLQDVVKPVVYSSNTRLVESDLTFRRLGWKPSRVRPTAARALVQSFATGCTMIFNRSAAGLYFKYRPDEIRVHDFLMYQVGVFFGTYLWDPTAHISYRQHGNNQMGQKVLKDRMHKRATSGNYKKNILERQARKFLEGYGDLMTDGQWEMVRGFVDYRKSLYLTLRLLFNRKISYTRLESDFFYRLKILLRGV